MFGQQQGTGLFGSGLSKPTGGLFSSATTSAPAFGATTTTTNSSLFGGQPGTSTGGLFGAKPTGSIFGTTTAPIQPSGSLFGQQQQQPAAPAFGAGGLFGANKPAQSAFGQVSQPSLFGQTQPQQSTAGGLFGAAAPSTGAFGTATTTTSSLFGTTTAPFGQQQQPHASSGLFGGQQAFGGATFGVTQPTTGTNVAKFTPPTGSDTMQLKGSQTTVSTKQMCVSAMKEYENRSLEELRVADYLAGRKVNTNAPAGSTLFGSQQQQSTGLFGSGLAKPAGGLFSAATTSAPAFGAATTTTNTSLFGGQPGTSTGGLFGAKPTGSIFGTTTAPVQPGAGLFGQQQQQPAAPAFGGGGLFGANKPAQSTFGQVSQPSLFGGQTQPHQSIAGGLFGAGAAAPSTGAFGTATTTTASLFGGTGAFGQPQQHPQAGSLFGAKPATQPTFGAFGAAQQPAFGGATTGGSLFGATAPKIGGGLFGAQQQPTMGGGLFGPTGTQSMFGAQTNVGMGGSPPILLGSNVNISGIQQAIIDAQLSTLPYGDSPLLKSPVSPRKSPQDISSLQRQLQLGTSRKSYDQLLSSPTNGILSSSTDKVHEPSKNTLTSDLNGSLLDSSFSYKPLVLLPSVGFGAALGLHQSPKLIKSTSDKSLSEKSSFLSRTIPDDDKKIKSLDMSVVLEPYEGDLLQTSLVTPPQKSTEPPRRIEETPASLPPQPVFEQIPISRLSPPPPAPSQQTQQLNDSQTSTTSSTPPKKYRIKLNRPEYYSEPSLDELEELFNSDGICLLEGGLTVGRLGYGSVFWKGPVELRELLDLDEIVHFRNKEVIVYPDETKKPEIGSGLNKQAEVSLERVWPVDPKTKQLIKDPDELRRIGFREKLERLSQRMDSTFRDYQPATGTWQFEVQHFSKYGFLDDEDEPSLDTRDEESKKMMQQAHERTLIQKAKVPLREIQKSLEGTEQTIQKQPESSSAHFGGNTKRALGEEDLEEGESYVDRKFMDFNEDTKLFQDEIIRKKFKFDDTLFVSTRLLETMAEKEDQLARRRPPLVERSPKNVFKGLSALEISKSGSILARAGIHMQRRSCRAGFTEGLVFVAPTHGCYQNAINIFNLAVIPTLKHYFMRFITSKEDSAERQQLLEQFDSSQLVNFNSPSPLLNFLDKFVVVSHQNGKGGIDEAISEICSFLLVKADTIEEKIVQRARMGNWLRARLAGNKPPRSTPFSLVFHHLVNGSVQNAINAARQAQHYNLALLLSLYKSPSTQLVRKQTARQLALMNRRNSDPHYVKILELLSGEWTKSIGGCLDGLDWLQILGLLIWYHASPTTTLLECMDALDGLVTK